MVPSLRRLLVGPADASLDRRLALLSAASLFVLTTAAYALGLFAVGGCVVLLPGQAVLIGLVAAAGVGSRGTGLLFAWLVAFAPLLGFLAESALFGYPGRSLLGGLAAAFDPEGLVMYAIAAVVFGTVGFAVGYLVRLVVGRLRREVSARRA